MSSETGGTETSVIDRVVGVARNHLDLDNEAMLSQPKAALLNLRLVEDLGLDSIQLLTLAVEVENHFEVALDGFEPGGEGSAGDQTDAISTLGDLVRLIEQATEV